MSDERLAEIRAKWLAPPLGRIAKDFEAVFDALDAAREETAELRRDLSESVASLVEQRNQYKRVYHHAIECVDAVFQQESGKEPPILPEFCTLGADKFEAVKELAIQFSDAEAEINKLRCEVATLRAQLASRPAGLTVEEALQRVCEALRLFGDGNPEGYQCVIHDDGSGHVTPLAGMLSESVVQFASLESLAAWVEQTLTPPPKVRTRRFTATRKETGEWREGIVFPTGSIGTYDREGVVQASYHVSRRSEFESDHSDIRWIDAPEGE